MKEDHWLGLVLCFPFSVLLVIGRTYSHEKPSVNPLGNTWRRRTRGGDHVTQVDMEKRPINTSIGRTTIMLLPSKSVGEGVIFCECASAALVCQCIRPGRC